VTIEIAATKTVKFTAGKAFKHAVNPGVTTGRSTLASTPLQNS
jgi:hypothetical protein